MDTTAGSTVHVLSQKRKASDFIKHLPARNLHHGIRLASSLGLHLNLFVSISFAHTACLEENADLAFRQIRARFGKWITRPKKTAHRHRAAPTFVWVIENPDGKIHAHWLVHVPSARQAEFKAKLKHWLEQEAGTILSEQAIDIKPAATPTAAGKYMLKGMFPSLARYFGIDPIYQGWVTGKRIGHSKNIGPVQAHEMRRQGRFPKAQRWNPNKYKTSNGGSISLPKPGQQRAGKISSF